MKSMAPKQGAWPSKATQPPTTAKKHSSGGGTRTFNNDRGAGSPANFGSKHAEVDTTKGWVKELPPATAKKHS